MFSNVAHEALAHFREKNKFATERQKTQPFLPKNRFYNINSVASNNYAGTTANPDQANREV
jgi:hypothetical protein